MSGACILLGAIEVRVRGKNKRKSACMSGACQLLGAIEGRGKGKSKSACMSGAFLPLILLL